MPDINFYIHSLLRGNLILRETVNIFPKKLIWQLMDATVPGLATMHHSTYLSAAEQRGEVVRAVQRRMGGGGGGREERV